MVPATLSMLREGMMKIAAIVAIISSLFLFIFSFFRPSPYSSYISLLVVLTFALPALRAFKRGERFLQALPGSILIILFILCSVLFFYDLKTTNNLANIFLYLATVGIYGQMIYAKFRRLRQQ